MPLDSVLGEQPGERVVVEEGAVGLHNVAAGQILGSGNVPGDGISRFHLAAVSFRRPGVESGGGARGHLLGRHGRTVAGMQIIMRHSHIPGRWFDRPGLESAAGRPPGGQPAVQNADVVQP
uniref:hypothetical protein n=1 Tax=Mycobacterium avium TaxID=1764 RepID=UPI000A78C4A3